jgi:hypothetical protein
VGAERVTCWPSVAPRLPSLSLSEGTPSGRRERRTQGGPGLSLRVCAPSETGRRVTRKTRKWSNGQLGAITSCHLPAASPGSRDQGHAIGSMTGLLRSIGESKKVQRWVIIHAQQEEVGRRAPSSHPESREVAPCWPPAGPLATASLNRSSEGYAVGPLIPR